MGMISKSLFAIAALCAATVASASAEEQDKAAPADLAESDFLQQMIDPEGKWPVIQLSADKKTIYLTGNLFDGSYFKFVKLLRTAPGVQTVYLSSAGGRTYEGRLIAAAVRKYKLNTYVETYCASACTQIFVAGKDRSIGPRGKIGFHQSYVLKKDGDFISDIDLRGGKAVDTSGTGVVGVDGDAAMRLAYRRAGVDESFITKVFATRPDDMWHPDVSEMLSSRVATRQAGFAELPAAPEGSTAWDDALVELEKRPIWSLTRSKDPALFEQATSDVWRGVNIGLSQEEAIIDPTQLLIDKGFELQARAPDELLGRILSYYAEAALFERGQNYAGCKPKRYLERTKLSTREQRIGELQEALAVELLANSVWVEPIDASKAERQFRGLADNIARQGRIDYNASGASENDCKLGLQMFEAISSLDAKRRLKAYRALVSMPRDN
jgi:hypothetical protein